MATWEISSSPEYGPYGAIIGTDAESFFVRIEPPFIPGDGILTGDEVEFTFVASDTNATMLRTIIDKDDCSFTEMRELVEGTTIELLKQLGEISQKKLFVESWDKYKIEEMG